MTGELITLEARRGRLNLRLTATFMGQDLCVALSGGDRPHIGAAALSQGGAAAAVLTLPGHREDALARKLAQELATATQTTVCVACGIHLDDIHPEEIQDALELAQDLTQELRRRLRERPPTGRASTPS